jgi:hypothetical protein
MKRITNEQREAIVRRAVAERDALLDCAGGMPCSDCPDKRKCERGCVRKPEFISAEHHALGVGVSMEVGAGRPEPFKPCDQCSGWRELCMESMRCQRLDNTDLRASLEAATRAAVGVLVVGHACKLDGSICESRPDRCSDCPAAGGKS